MQVTVGSRTGLVAGVVYGVSLLVDGSMGEQQGRELLRSMSD
jgi:hypothetical protein